MDKKLKKVLRDNAFRSAFRYEPERVTVTRERHGKKAAHKMQVAIALDEARKLKVD